MLWEEAQSIKQFTVCGLGCTYSRAMEHRPLCKNLRLRKKPNLNLGMTHWLLQLETEDTSEKAKCWLEGFTKLQVFDVAVEDNFFIHLEFYHIPVFYLL